MDSFFISFLCLSFFFFLSFRGQWWSNTAQLWGPSEVSFKTSYLWGILGQARGPTAPRGTEPPSAPMPPPCHPGAAARCLGRSSSAWCEGKGKQASRHFEPKALSQPAEDKDVEARPTPKQTKPNSFEKYVRSCPVESSRFETAFLKAITKNSSLMIMA